MRGKYAPLSKLAIKADQPLLFPVYNKQGVLLAEKGTQLSQDQVEKILDLDAVYTLDRALLSALTKAKSANDESSSVFKLPPPLKRLASLEKILHDIYENPLDPTSRSKILTLISRLQTICEKSPNAAIAKIITDDSNNYAIKHAIHTAILCELSSQYLNWDAEHRRSIVGAALTMNISLGFLQNKLLDQPQPLTIEQKETINNHPLKSAEILKKIGVSNTTWLELVEKHHENIDGTGYPAGLTQSEIPIGSSLISLADVYCAKVTGRSYREPIFANVAVRDIYLEKDQAHAGTLIEVFVKLLGLYPPGCMVKLKSNEVGIVVKRGERVDTPIVLIINKANTVSSTFKVKRNTGEKNFAIQSIIQQNQELYSLDYDEIWPN